MTDPTPLSLAHACPRCGTETGPDNKFCEECGFPLTASPESAEGHSSPHSEGCSKCGAPPSQIGDDGFCSSCGFRQEESARNHLEIDIAPWFAGVTDRGVRHRRNEDSLALEWINERSAFGAESPQRACVLVVCDGVSSTREPDRASEAAARETVRLLIEILASGNQFTVSDMQSVIAGAQQAVAAVPFTKLSGQDSPATTIVAAVAWETRVVIGWMGDSRAYWIAGSASRQLTADHSWMWEAVAAGEVTEEEAAKSPNAHAITRWLGADMGEVEASVVDLPIETPGRLLLCSDGLWNYAPSAEAIAELAAKPEGESGAADGNALAIARNLVQFAIHQGGQDNITVALLSFGAEEWSKQIDD